MSSGSGPQASSREQGSQPGSNKRPNSIHCGRKRRKGVVLRNMHDQTKPARTTTACCTTQELPLYLPPPTSWRGITHRPALAGNAEFQIFLLSSPCKGKMHQVLAHLLTDHLPIFETKYKRTFSRLNYFVGGGKKQFWNHEALSYETQLKQKSKNLQGSTPGRWQLCTLLTQGDWAAPPPQLLRLPQAVTAARATVRTGATQHQRAWCTTKGCSSEYYSLRRLLLRSN